MNELINVQDQNGILTVSSRQVAEHFEKEHKHILGGIANILLKLDSAEKSAQYFISSEYKDPSGKSNKEWLLTRDGFSLLVMGFTGSKALEWKLKYIDAFNRMEQAAKQSMQGLSPQLQLLIGMELKQKQQDAAIACVANKVDKLESTIETFSQPITSNWCDEMNNKINKMCHDYGLNYQVFRGELYNELEIQANCNLGTRQKRKRERMDKAGAKYAERNAVTKLHIIGDDSKLKLIFEGIVRKYQMRYAG